MPFTPFHFGPGAALKAAAPARFSLTIFCYSQVVTDLETGFYLVWGEYPVHRFFHTFIGATLVGIFCALSGRPLCQFALRICRDCFGALDTTPLIKISWRVAFVSAFVGTLSHVVLDGIMHQDARPFRPFTDANPMLHLVGTPLLHQLCIALGIAGVLILLSRMAGGGPPAQAKHNPARPGKTTDRTDG